MKKFKQIFDEDFLKGSTREKGAKKRMDGNLKRKRFLNSRGNIADYAKRCSFVVRSVVTTAVMAGLARQRLMESQLRRTKNRT